MDMGMMRQRLTPCVQDGDEADLGAEPARVRGEHHHCLGGGLEQDGVDSGLVLEGDHRDLRRQREDDVEVGNRKEFSLARGEPSCTGRSLALRTVPVAAGVVGDPRHAAVVAGLDVTAERPRPARDDCAHHAPFDTAEMAGVRLAISVAMAAQDIGNLNERACSNESRRGPWPASQRSFTRAALPQATDDRAGSASPGSYGWQLGCSAPWTTDCYAQAGPG